MKRFFRYILFLTLLLSLAAGAFSQPVGATFFNPIEAGTFDAGGGTFTDTKNNHPSNGYGNERGSNADDIFYRFTLTTDASFTISTCGSSTWTWLHLLNSSGENVFYQSGYGPLCPNTYRESIKGQLHAGTYYIVSETNWDKHGTIITSLTIDPSPGGNGTPSSLSSNQNFVATYTPRVPGIISAAQLNNKSVSAVNQEVQYLDGLGRTVQTVKTFASPGKNDVIVPVEYDSHGREAKKYLVYTDAGSGSYRSNAIGGQSGFFNNPPAGVVQTAYPFSETRFEPSPLSRVEEQGAVGVAWQLSGGHTTKLGYSANSVNEVMLWDLTSSGAGVSGYYQPNELYKTVTKDENWTSGKSGTTEEFKDKEGHVVLKRTWENESSSLSTYYVYDDIGNLSYVIPPGVTVTSFTEGDPQFNQYIYAYHYDSRQRVVEKKIPGKGWEYQVYNTLDQVVATQDAVQRSQNKWVFIKYDGLGRVIITGIYNDGNSRAGLQASVSSQLYLWESRGNTPGSDYTNNTFPTTGVSQYLTVNYYDDYTFPGASGFYAQSTVSNKTRGLLTGTRLSITDGSASHLSINYYDEDGRIKESVSENHVGGSDRVINTYSFTGELLASNRTHSSASQSAVVATRYTYDHAGRKKQSFQKTGDTNSSEVLVSELDYNETGELKEKHLHRKSDGTFLQDIAYSYNERGWLRTQSSPKFSMDLRYENPTAGTQYFNGNVSQQFYCGDYSGCKSLSYTYDKIDRLTDAISSTGTLNEHFSYDKMGNIQTLSRGGSGYGTLSFSYYNNGESNQLASISGSGFTTRSYAYDDNGNANSDGLNKTIVYNMLNLPLSVTQNGSTIATYTYDASGEKIQNAGSDGVWDYLDGIHYKNGQIEFIKTDEGRAVNTGNGYNYVYDLKDHLGNVRVSLEEYNGQARVVQEDEYYSFGLHKSLYNFSNNNRYLYNGKEKQTDLEDQYDYGARFYDPVIGRWSVVDALADEQEQVDKSPYAFTWNNPVNLTDPDGNCPKCLKAVAKTVVKSAIKGKLDLGEIYDIVDAGATLINPSSSWLDKGEAVFNIVSPVSTKELKAVGKVVGLADDAKDASKATKRAFSKADRAKGLEKSKDLEGKPRCEYCNVELDPKKGKPNSYEADHRDAYAKGGESTEKNLAPSCRTCNREKGKKEIGKEWIPPKERKKDGTNGDINHQL